MKKFLMSFVFLSLILSGCGEMEDAELNLPVLMYHDFSYDVENSLTVHPDDLRDQLTALQEAGYETISDQDIVDYRNGDTDNMPDQPVLITIDDGYLSNYELAYPIFKEFEKKATIYVIVERRDSGYDNHFTWEQAAEMYESGFIDIQHHTYNSHKYVESKSGEERPLLVAVKPDESEDEYSDRIRNDLDKGLKQIENKVGNNVHSFTFPYGVYNDRVLDVSKDLGLNLFFTVKEQMNGEEEIQEGILHRFNVPGGMSGEELIEMIQ